ncbi:hypothetical protein NW801_13230 [Brevibacillus laterosporus]|uniref:MotA/TolQ/ExbB proton channel domain-containing protein n=1 Tax=Brevibacillus halotolerans TaxID=1507437 RepID=A0ABT4HY42_9BACL|nr:MULTISPECIES: hypothetical protein [Brevibacillus]MCR8985984.1 hypothetical protein [Brevibacillus laterosporus]MCZ0831717.1 hypothetical protein [Brevibacillus halotolerans]
MKLIIILMLILIPLGTLVTLLYQRFTWRRIYADVIYKAYEEMKRCLKVNPKVSPVYGDCYDSAYQKLSSLGLNELETEKLYVYVNSKVSGKKDAVVVLQSTKAVCLSLLCAFLGVMASFLAIFISKHPEMVPSILDRTMGILLWVVVTFGLLALLFYYNTGKDHEIDSAMLHIIKRYKKENFSNSTL